METKTVGRIAVVAWLAVSSAPTAGADQATPSRTASFRLTGGRDGAVAVLVRSDGTVASATGPLVPSRRADGCVTVAPSPTSCTGVGMRVDDAWNQIVVGFEGFARSPSSPGYAATAVTWHQAGASGTFEFVCSWEPNGGVVGFFVDGICTFGGVTPEPGVAFTAVVSGEQASCLFCAPPQPLGVLAHRAVAILF